MTTVADPNTHGVYMGASWGNHRLRKLIRPEELKVSAIGRLIRKNARCTT